MDFSFNALNAIHGAAVFKRRVRVLSRIVAAEIRGGTSVLDLGCGDGSLAKAIMTVQPQLEFHGIDVLIRPQAVIPIDLFDGETIPFSNKSFDWVTIVDVLHHTDNPKQLLTEGRRVARRGVIVKDHLRQGFGASASLRLMDWIGNKGHKVNLPYNYISKDEWDRIFAEARVTVKTWTEDLGIYPGPLRLLFDRRLHFIATLE
jgi:SAM-dependent methyltransferase